MAVVNTKSSTITAGDVTAGISTPIDPRLTGSRVREKVGTLEVANGDSIGSTLRLVRVRSSDRISALRVYCDAITSAAADFGLYRTARDGGAAVDVDFFATAQSIATAILTGTDITFEANAGPANVANIEQPLWQALGLTADPGVEYDITATLTAAATAAGTLSVRVHYVDGN